MLAGEVSRDRACAPLSIRGGAATSCVDGRPTRELQSLLHMMKLEEGKGSCFCHDRASVQLYGDV